MQHRLAVPAVLMLALAAAACGYDSNGTYGPNPDPDSSAVVGSYQAVTITNTAADKTIDLLKDTGLIFTMTLKPDGTMTGRYTITTGTAAPGNNFDITGTWVVTGTTLMLEDNSNSFISSVDYTIADRRLEGTRTINQSEVRVVLERQEG